MASLLRPWRTDYRLPDGTPCQRDTPGAAKHRRQVKKWYGQLKLRTGRRVRVPLSTDKSVAWSMLVEIDRAERLAERGIIEPTPPTTRPIADDLADFDTHLRVGGSGPEYVEAATLHVRRFIAAAGVQTAAQLTAAAAERWISDMRVAGRSACTVNHHIDHLKRFGRWLEENDRIPRNPFARLRRTVRGGDRRRVRRDLTIDEVRRLLDTTGRSDRIVWGLDGRDRRALYLTAVATGLRIAELCSLTRDSFHLDGSVQYVFVEGRYTKNGKPAAQPITLDVADDLRRWLDTKPPTGRLWDCPAGRKGATTLLTPDLDDAGIPYRDEHGWYADFHALRHSYITYLDRAFISTKEAQTLARHSDVRMTLDTYTHTDLGRLAEAVRRLPSPLCTPDARM